MLFGITSAAIAVIAVLAVQRKVRRCSDRKRFSKAGGTYKGYAVKEPDFREIEEKPRSEAEITYREKNILDVKVTYTNKRTWKGTMVLDNEHYGTIGWRYVRMHPGQVEFGFKRCVLEPDGNRIFLIDAMYGKEVLARDRRKV